MNSKRFLTLAGAVATFAAGSAYAQHDHGGMHGGAQHGAASSGIAEGTVKRRSHGGGERHRRRVRALPVKANKGEKVRFIVTRKTTARARRRS